MSMLSVKPSCSRFALRSVTSVSNQALVASAKGRRLQRCDLPADDEKILLVPVAGEIGLELRKIFLRGNFIAGQNAHDFNAIAESVLADLPDPFVFLAEMGKAAKL